MDTKVCPDGPCVVVGQLTTGGDAMANSFPHKVEIMLESNSLVGWTYVQEGCVGKVWFIRFKMQCRPRQRNGSNNQQGC